MKYTLQMMLLFLAVGLFAACGDKAPDADHDHDGHGHKDGHDDDDGDDHDGDDHDDGDGHDHDGDDHDGDDHDDDDGHDHDGDDHDDHDGDEHGGHGERHDVGAAKAGAHNVTLAVFGEIEAGHEAVLDIEVEGAALDALRAWVGVESGKGSLKAKLDGEDGDYHGHIEVPATLPEGSAIWVEVEAAGGKRAAVSFAIPK